MASRPGYRLVEKTDGPEAWQGWYYEPEGSLSGTGPFSDKELARQAAELWVNAMIYAEKQKQKNKP